MSPIVMDGRERRRTLRGAGRRWSLPAQGLLLLIVAGALWLGAIAVTPERSRVPVAWCAGVACVVLVAVQCVANWRLRRAELRAHQAAAAHQRSQTGLQWVEAELSSAAQLLPQLRQRVEEQASADTILDELRSAGRLPQMPAVGEFVSAVVEVLYAERRRRSAVVAVLQAGANRVQAAVTEATAELGERKRLYWAHGDAVERTRVRADMEAVDERLAVLGLLAGRMTTLTTARRLGRPWPKPIPLERVLRAALQGSADYRRVELALPRLALAVASPAVNAIIQVLGEVIDNAVRFSPPNKGVRVEAEESSTGVAIYVDDSGLVMDAERLERARRIVDLDQPFDLSSLSGAQLGLPAARIAAQRYNIRITFGTSGTGGTRAAVWLGWDHLVREQPTGAGPTATSPVHRAPCPPLEPHPPQGLPAPRPSAAPRADQPPAPPVEEEQPVRAAGLPPLPRRPEAVSRPPAAPQPSIRPQQSAAPDPEKTLDRFAAFRAATRDPSASDPSEENDR